MSDSIMNKSDVFIMSNAKYFPEEVLPQLKAAVEGLDNDRYNALFMQTYRDPLMMLIVSLIAGGLGVDRILLGQTGLGILKLLTCGGVGIWAIIDWFLIMGLTRDANLDKVRPIVAPYTHP